MAGSSRSSQHLVSQWTGDPERRFAALRLGRFCIPGAGDGWAMVMDGNGHAERDGKNRE
jgi:hypothetical protein